MNEVLTMLGEQLEQLRPENKPSSEQISAARGAATVSNSYVSIVRLGMEYSRMQGIKPDLGFLKIGKIEDAKRAKETLGKGA